MIRRHKQTSNVGVLLISNPSGNILPHQFLTPPVADTDTCRSVGTVSPQRSHPKNWAVGRVFVQTTDGSINAFAYNLMWSCSVFVLSCGPKRGDTLEDCIGPVLCHAPLLPRLRLHMGWEMWHSGYSSDSWKGMRRKLYLSIDRGWDFDLYFDCRACQKEILFNGGFSVTNCWQCTESSCFPAHGYVLQVCARLDTQVMVTCKGIEVQTHQRNKQVCLPRCGNTDVCFHIGLYPIPLYVPHPHLL